MSGWIGEVLSLEIRKILAYRAAFWVKVILSTGTELTVGYFLWGAIFATTGATAIGGYSFAGLLYYTFFASLGANVVRTLERGVSVSDEIYQGTLSRYLVYPVPYLLYRYVTYLGQQLLCVAQFLIGAVIALAVFGVPADLSITPASLALGLGTALMSGMLSFLIMACLEQIAFWQDTVWNLIAMYRFIGNLLGGLLVPLSLFPEWGRKFAAYTPFPSLYSFPVRCLLGKIDAAEWFFEAARLGGWIVCFGGLAALVWRRGTRTYSGVGI